MTAASKWLVHQLPEMERTLAALVNINSHTANREGNCRTADVVQDLFSIEGLTCERMPSQRYGDHLVFRSTGRAGAPPVALLGHMDTVFPPGLFEGYRVEGALRRGPGVLDMKGGLVVMAWALKAVALHGGLQHLNPLRIVLVSDEEVGSPEGAPLIRQSVAGCQAALVFESGRANDAIVTTRKGSMSLKAFAHGKAAHAGNAYWEGANAIWALSRFIDCAQSLSQKEQGVTVNVGLVAGGSARNTVPAAAWAEVDARFPTHHSGEALQAQLQAAADGHGVGSASVSLLSLGTGRPPMEKQPGTDALVALYGECAAKFGMQAGEAPRQGGGSDGNTTAALGIPTIDALGPRGSHFHTPEEYIEAETLVFRAQALAEFLMRLP